MEELALNFILALVKAVVKNPKKKAALRARLLKIRDAISAAYDE